MHPQDITDVHFCSCQWDTSLCCKTTDMGVALVYHIVFPVCWYSLLLYTRRGV